MAKKTSIPELLSTVTYLPNRTPEMALTGAADGAFAKAAAYRDGAIFVGHYSGNSEWERHPEDEIVMALEGSTTVVLLQEGEEERVALGAGELLVVPKGRWHRFDNSEQLKIFSVTPAPTEHRLELPKD